MPTMSRTRLAALALLFSTVSASKGVTTTTPPVVYTTAHGACECEGHCIITTKAECEAAASSISHHDVTANEVNDPNFVRGCALNRQGGLRINHDMTSTRLHPDGRAGPDQRLVLCQECPGPVTTPASGCHTTEAPTTTTEPAPTTTTEPAPTTTTEEPTTTTEEPTTTTEEPTTTTEDPTTTTEDPTTTTEDPTTTTEDPTTTTEPTTTCPYVASTALCECEGYHTITTHAECEEAAAFLGFSDTEAADVTKNFVAGCATNKLGVLRFNNNLASTAIQPEEPGKNVLCKACNPDATTPAHAVCPAEYIRTNQCDGESYCTINSAADCDEGAAELSLPDTKHTEVDRPNKVPGCFYGFSDLVYNPTGNPNAEHGRNAFTVEICRRCSSVKSGASSLEPLDTQNDHQWWIYVAVAAGVVVVVAVVVVAVVLSSKKARKTVTPTDGGMTVVGGDTVAI